MDDTQTDHLKAYGLAYWALQRGQQGEWLLNYRGGSFLLPDDARSRARRTCAACRRAEASRRRRSRRSRAEIADNNMESVVLEKAPRVAVYIPPNTPPWDDAVTLALEYADIPYAKVWDEEVLRRRAREVRLAAPAPRGLHRPARQVLRRLRRNRLVPEEERVQNEAMARQLGFAKVSQLKAAVAPAIKDTSAQAGSCSACARRPTPTTSRSPRRASTSPTRCTTAIPPTPTRTPSSTSRARSRSRTSGSRWTRSSTSSRTSTSRRRPSLRGPRNDYFTLFDFSAKNDPVPTMLVQNHVANVPEFLGQTTGFDERSS